MPGKKRVILIGIGLLLSFALLIAGCGQKSSAPSTSDTPEKPAKAVELKMVGSYPLNAPEWTMPKQFVEKVNKELEGKLKITIAGGPELIPTTELANAVRTGATDVSFSMAAQYVPLVPEADAFKLASLTPEEMRANGAYKFIDKLFNEKANSHFLGFGIFGREWFHFFSNKQLESMDLSGLIFRSVPIYDPLLKALGAKVTTLDMTEINTAMDRGVITAFNYPVAGADDNGFGQAAKFVCNHGFYSAEPIMAMNLDKWKQLPKDVQETIDKLAGESEMKSMTWCKEWEDASIKDLKDEFHLTFYDLPAAEKEKLYKTAEEAGWAKIKERSPENWEQMKKFLTQK